MASKNLFDSDLSEVSAVSAPSRGGGGAPPIVKTASAFDGVDDALRTIANWDINRQKVRERETVAEVDSGVDQAIENAFAESMGDMYQSDIDSTLDRLDALRKAAGQGRDRTDRFNISLMREAKQLKARYPDRTAAINQAFAARGLIDPRTALLNKQAEIEDNRQRAEEARLEKMIGAAVEGGFAVYKEPGNPGSGVDRPATFAAMQNAADIQKRTAETYQRLGLVRDEKGQLGYTIRPEYAAARPQLEADIWNQALIGLRPAVNNLQAMLAAGNPQNLQMIRDETSNLISMADKFRVRIMQESVMSLNPKEREEHMKFVDEVVLQPLLQVATNIRDAKDINQMQAAANVLDWSSKNFQLMNHRDAPTLSRLVFFNRDLATSFLNNVKLNPNFLEGGNNLASRELNTILDMTPPNGTPTDAQIDMDAGEGDYSKEQRATRVQVGIKTQQDFISKGIVASTPADVYGWLGTQKPLYNAFKEAPLSGNDVKRLTDQMLTANYSANLTNAVKHFPEAGRKVGAYSFDVVERRLLDLSRELRTTPVGSKIGQEFAFSYNPSKNKFEIKSLNPKKDGVQTAIEGIAAGVPGGMGVPQFSQDYSRVKVLQDRLNEVNKILPHLAKTRQYKPEYEGVSDDEFLMGFEALLNGRI